MLEPMRAFSRVGLQRRPSPISGPGSRRRRGTVAPGVDGVRERARGQSCASQGRVRRGHLLDGRFRHADGLGADGCTTRRRQADRANGCLWVLRHRVGALLVGRVGAVRGVRVLPSDAAPQEHGLEGLVRPELWRGVVQPHLLLSDRADGGLRCRRCGRARADAMVAADAAALVLLALFHLGNFYHNPLHLRVLWQNLALVGWSALLSTSGPQRARTAPLIPRVPSCNAEHARRPSPTGRGRRELTRSRERTS